MFNLTSGKTTLNKTILFYMIVLFCYSMINFIVGLCVNQLFLVLDITDSKVMNFIFVNGLSTLFIIIIYKIINNRLYYLRNKMKVESSVLFNNKKSPVLYIYIAIILLFLKMGIYFSNTIYNSEIVPSLYSLISGFNSSLIYDIQRLLILESFNIFEKVYPFYKVILNSMLYFFLVFKVTGLSIFNFNFELGIIYDEQLIKFKKYYIFVNAKNGMYYTSENFFHVFNSCKDNFSIVNSDTLNHYIKDLKSKKYINKLANGNYYCLYISEALTDSKTITQAIWNGAKKNKNFADNYFITDVDLNNEISTIEQLQLLDENLADEKIEANEIENTASEVSTVEEKVKNEEEVDKYDDLSETYINTNMNEFYVNIYDFDPMYLYESNGKGCLFNRVRSIIIVISLYSLLALCVTFVVSYIALLLKLSLTLSIVIIFQFGLLMYLTKFFKIKSNKIYNAFKIEKFYLSRKISYLILLVPVFAYYFGKFLAFQLYIGGSSDPFYIDYIHFITNYLESNIVILSNLTFSSFFTKLFVFLNIYILYKIGILGYFDLKNGIYINDEFITFEKRLYVINNVLYYVDENDSKYKRNNLKYFNYFKKGVCQVEYDVKYARKILKVYYGHSTTLNKTIVFSNIVEQSFYSSLRNSLPKTFLVFEREFEKELEEVSYCVDGKWEFK